MKGVAFEKDRLRITAFDVDHSVTFVRSEH
jgi:hypothetical protein